MTISRSKVAAVTASLVFALSGGVAIADEAATTTPAAETTTQEQAATPAAETTDAQVTADTDAAPEAKEGEATADATAGQDEGEGEQKSDESKSGETTDAQKADESKSGEAADAKVVAGSTDTAVATDDTALEAQVAEYTKTIHHRDTNTDETRTVSESDIEWVPVDVSKYSSDKYRYVDEDGFRIFYRIYNEWRPEGLDEAVKNESIVARVRIGENGEFLARAEQSTSYRMSTDHTDGLLQGANRSGVPGYGLASAYIDADVPKDAFTKTLVDKYGETLYYYPGGEYGPAGYYYRVTEDSHMIGLMAGDSVSRHVGMYWHFDTEGGSPFSGTSANSEGQAASAVTAATASYESGTATATPATGSAYVSPTASAAAETTPATSDATSLAGVAAAAVSALGALGLGKAIRRK